MIALRPSALYSAPIFFFSTPPHGATRRAIIFHTLLRGASHNSSTFHFVYRPSGPLQHVPAPLSSTSCRSKYFPTRRHIFRHRSTALRTSLRRSEFPTLLLGASHCSNIFPIGSVVLLAALIFSHTSPRGSKISRRSLRS